MSEELFPSYPRRESGQEWTIIDSDIVSYLRDFGIVDVDYKLLHLFEKLRSKPQPVIVDLMATTKALASIDEKIFEGRKRGKYIAVGTVDDRDDRQRALESARGIVFINEDLNKPVTWDRIEAELGDSRADLIIERGYGALHFVPTRLSFQRPVMSRMWHMASPDGGIIALQTPPQETLEERGIPVGRWLNQLTAAGIYHQFTPSIMSLDPEITYGMLLLEKTSSEQRLPELAA